MPLDPYAPCPCGNGQKVKFCCSADIIHDLDKVMRAIEGDQRAAALDQLNRLLQTRPDNPALLAIKSSVQLSLSEIEAAEKTIHHFLAVDPKNPTALAQGSAVAALRGNTRHAVERLQAALEESDGKINQHVHQSLRIVGETLLMQGDILGAYGHLMLYASTASPHDQEAARALARIRIAADLPLFLRQERYLEPAPADAAWKAKFDEAFQLAGKACWLKACEQFIALAERVPNEPRIIRNIAVLRGYLGDTSGAVLWWHKYASLEAVPLEDRVEAETLAQMLDVNLPREKVDLVQFTINIQDVDRVMERLLADKRLAAGNRDAYIQELEENEVPPKAVFSLLDRPMPATGVGIALADVPHNIGEVLAYGRETDKPARVQLTTERTPEFDLAKQTVQEVVGDQATDTQEEVVGEVPVELTTLRVAIYPPRDTPPDHFAIVAEEARRRVLTHTWPASKNRFLDNHVPNEVAGNLGYRVRLLASIMQLDQQNAGSNFNFNDLRSQLGLPTLDTIDPSNVEISRLPAWRLARLDVEKMTDEQLSIGFQRAAYYLDPPSLKRFGDALLARPASSAGIDPEEIYELLIRFSPQPPDAAEYAVRAQALARSKNQSPARFMLMELQARLIMGDVRTAQRLIEVLSTQYRNEPGVAQALMQLLVSMGIVSPDGRMRGTPAAGPAEPAAAPSGGLWTPGDPVGAPPAAEKKSSGLWLPD